MPKNAIEILPVGPEGTLFQICDGQLYGHLEVMPTGLPWDEVRERITIHPEVVDYLQAWLNGNGVLVGSCHPPRILWDDLRHQVPIARFF